MYDPAVKANRVNDEPQRILRAWWMLELFNPQDLKNVVSRNEKTEDKQTTELKPGSQLPWKTLPPPKPRGKTPRVWQHTVYLGVYNVKATYEILHEAFGDNTDAYEEGPAWSSACAAVVLDKSGKLIAGSAILSSALWGVGRVKTLGITHPAWADGFPEASSALYEEVRERAEYRAEGAPLVQDHESLQQLMHTAQSIAGVAIYPDLATARIFVESKVVSAARATEANDTDFLNSFYLDDLSSLHTSAAKGEHLGDALASYLTSDQALDLGHREDVLRTREATDAGVSIDRLPKGRWPADPKHGLSLRQQFAVNAALTDFAPTRGILAVNGPPGTGKTTMLRDILAGNIVERARRLAQLASPHAAFTSTTHRWKTHDGRTRTVKELIPELTGFEMVVASANNAAVENVTFEIPARDAIHKRWHDSANYFADLATAILDEGEKSSGEAQKIEAWGLIAARLGNKKNRDKFQSSFWYDKTDPKTNVPIPGSLPRMQTRLKEWAGYPASRKKWSEARAEFTRAEQRVDELIARRKLSQDHLERLPEAINSECASQQHIIRVQTALNDTERRLAHDQEKMRLARSLVESAANARDRHMGSKPGIIETIMSFGRATRDWRAALQPLDESLLTVENDFQQAEVTAHATANVVEILRRDLSNAQATSARASDLVVSLRRQIEVDKAMYGPAYPGSTWVGEARELRTPWLDAELDTARADLFLAALQLHQDFLANTAKEMGFGLRAAMEIIKNGGQRNLGSEERRAAWQLFFLVVPMVSTTFSSFGRMFADIGTEGIGWVFIDEAGQASPQCAAGAIWRAKRVVAVGDPLQLQPVVTIPRKVQRDIARSYGVSETWLPPEASVQTLADRVSRYGTTLYQEGQAVWVSAPLTVHRRCDDPMFSLCNDIAYNGIMVNGVTRTLDNPNKPDLFHSSTGPNIAASYWVDVPALTTGNHLQENQIARLEKALSYLAERGITPADVIAISPFRAVANRLNQLSRRYPGLTAGTIHTAQGREASVVFLVLGGDPAAPGAKAWAASTVNLVNVAASRAKRRLYVIGDRESWAKHNYFRQLAYSLQPGSKPSGAQR